jgi:C-methyltransferase C-terminal domain/Putative zinc binding domain/Methyltransferase domain
LTNPSTTAPASTTCRFCAAPLATTFVDLGMSPPCQTHITAEQLNRAEVFYPLHVYVCDACKLVQLQQFVSPQDIFEEYAYFSSYSTSWVEHARRYVEMACQRFGLGPGSSVVEIASNDGYLLQHFLPKGIPVRGVEPAANVAAAAMQKGIPTTVDFFGSAFAARLLAQQGPADLLLGNNVLAHVPDINDFVAGLRLLLAPKGSITMEFPHLARLMGENQFDTIYHEHFSYLSFLVVERVFAHHGLVIYDVEQWPTHGGSLRIFACHAAHAELAVQAKSGRAEALRAWELSEGFDRIERYAGFEEQVRTTKRKLLGFLIDAKHRGQKIAGFGAPGKGNTLLNYCGIRSDFLAFTTDANPYKQGKYTPGTHIPIVAHEKIREFKPDLLLILPWNLKDEIEKQMSFIRDWGGQFVIPIPEPQVF